MQRGDLKPAHKGYRYQDIVSAYFLIGAVVGRYDSVTIDKKLVQDDRYDDLGVEIAGEIYRLQIKSSTNKERALCLQDFTGASSSLRLDRLILTYKRHMGAAKEYRLCATWVSPKKEDQLLDVLDEVDHLPTIDATTVKFYQLKPELIWPEDSPPIWPVLTTNCEPGGNLSRDDFLGFCDKFYIELELPLASDDLLNPGPIELTVLKILSEDIGIGRYPNTERQCKDVAALAIALATLARTQDATLVPKEISKILEIRTDYGRVSQAFPLDKNYFYDRPNWRQSVRSNLNSGAIHILTAPPGAGKSWELTCLSEELSDEFIVARHYCYLEPGDELVERRVTTDVFFANIISELRDVAPEICRGSNRLSADLRTLEETLDYGASLGKQIIILIDGLDHISRVKSTSNMLSDNETDIIERIATLNIPPNVKIIIGSQPGAHLDPLLRRSDHDVCSYELSSWSESDVVELARLYRVDQTLGSIGINETNHLQEIFGNIAEKSCGNPLYARYLCKGLNTAIKSGDTASPADWLAAAPIINGNIAIYYKHLYDNIIREAQVIVDLFGVLDFSISENDLREMVPKMISAWLPSALTSLSPVLIEVAGQGGMRIFHESFRRFILDELEREGRNLHDILSTVIDWLKRRGFFIDAKCYRFLLPALRKSGKNEDIFRLVSASFVSESVSCGHPIEAIQKNLAITADVAGRLQNWPVLVRCAELRRSLSACFDPGQNPWGSFWTSYSELFGVDSLNERLLFDGKPTLPYEEGLYACLLVDDMGGTPPWTEYLKLPHNSSTSGYISDIDHEKQLLEEDSLTIATIQGRFRTGARWQTLRRFYKYLLTQKNPPRFLFIRKVTARFCKNGGTDAMKKMASIFEGSNDYISSAVYLGIADELTNIGETDAAKTIAEQLLNTTKSSSIAVMCMNFGAEPIRFDSIDLSLDSIELGLGSSACPNFKKVRQWVSNIRMLTRRENGLAKIAEEKNRVQGAGWYSCWLRYVLALYEAEYKKNSGLPYDLKSVFSFLTEDVRPFAGKPRACDIYLLHLIIKETLAFGLSLLETKEEWDHALKIILVVSNETATRLDREDGGPVSIGTVIDLVLPYTSNEIIGDKVYSTIERQIQALNLSGSYYSTHAENTMKLVSAQIAYGDIETAKENWKKVGAYLAGYGFHKDPTLFDIIETISVLQHSSKDHALLALEKIQPLVAAVLAHTDGRTTNKAPNTWFNSLLSVDSASAIEVLYRTLTEDDGIENWSTINALKAVARYSLAEADPRLVNALWETILFEIEYENEAKNAAQDRLKPLMEIHQIDSSLATERLIHLSAEASNDASKNNYDAVKTIEEYALENNYEIRCNISNPTKSGSFSNNPAADESTDLPVQLYDLPFPANASYIDILAGLRAAFDLPNEQRKKWWRSIAVYLSYKIDELLDAEDEAGARRILHFYALEISTPLSSDLHPIGDLAQCLENAGHNSLAAIAYSLLYAHSRGGGGWYSFGDKTHRKSLVKAIELDSDIAKQTLSENVSYRLRHVEYGAGISKGLIERTYEWGEDNVAASCWQEAFQVIAHRLPLTQENSWFASFNANKLSDFNADEGLVSLLLARLSEPRASRRVSSLNGLLNALRYCSESVTRPLNLWINRDTPVSSLLLVFQLLFFAERSPYYVTSSLSETLIAYTQSECWGAAIFARKLLERIGINTPIVFVNRQEVDHLPNVTKEQVEYVTGYDLGGLLEMLSEFDSELPERVCKILIGLLGQEVQNERIRERLKLSFGRDGKAYPPTNVVYWQFELFEAILHDQANMVRENLWSKGVWNDEIELSMLLNAQPDLAFHLAIFNSRVPRPSWKEPSEQREGLSELQVVDGDPRYQGWICLGTVEKQYLSRENSFSPPKEEIKAYSGAVVAPIGAIYYENLIPFLKGEYDFWWEPERFFVPQRPLDIYTQLLSLDKNSDWLGGREILIPPAEISAFIKNITVPDFSENLVWKDSKGVPILACRFWQVQGQQFDVESPSLIGCDLIARPDVVNTLERLFSCPLKLHTKIQKIKIDD